MAWDVRKYLPAGIVALLAAVLGCWNSFVGMTWLGPSTAYIAFATSPLLLLALYTRHRGDRVFPEICLFLYLYFLFPMLGVKLSYLATTLNHPFADTFLAATDAKLGFSWNGWAAGVDHHPMFKAIVSAAYASPIVQAVGSVLLFSIVANGQRNYEVMLALLLALAFTIVTYAFLPALGPQTHLGVPTSYARMITTIRSGHVTNLVYTGIVWFPSYHTVMAIIFTYGHRGLKYSFAPVLALNGLMLLAIPSIGLHYLTDMIGGAAVALVSIVAVRHICQPKRFAAALFAGQAVAAA